MKTFRWLPLLVLIALLCGCAGKPTLIGKWTNSQPGGVHSMTYEFRENGEFVQTQKSGLGERSMTGTWKSDGDNLTLTYPTASHPDERTQNNAIRLQSRTLDFMFNGKPHLTLVKTAP